MRPSPRWERRKETKRLRSQESRPARIDRAGAYTGARFRFRLRRKPGVFRPAKLPKTWFCPPTVPVLAEERRSVEGLRVGDRRSGRKVLPDRALREGQWPT